MSQYREAEVSFPWLPLLLLLSAGVLLVLMARWGITYLRCAWSRPTHHKKKKRRSKKQKYSDSDSSSEESSE